MRPAGPLGGAVCETEGDAQSPPQRRGWGRTRSSRVLYHRQQLALLLPSPDGLV